MYTTVEVLRRARARLATGGWFRGARGGRPDEYALAPGKADTRQCHCLATAIFGAVTSTYEERQAMRAIWITLGSPGDKDNMYDAIYRVNDAQAVEDGYGWAIRVFDEAIRLSDAGLITDDVS